MNRFIFCIKSSAFIEYGTIKAQDGRDAKTKLEEYCKEKNADIQLFGIVSGMEFQSRVIER